MYWLNIDKTTKKCVIHINGCSYERKKEETLWKGISELKRDGGWLSFTSMDEAERHFRNEWSKQGYELSRDCRCLNK